MDRRKLVQWIAALPFLISATKSGGCPVGQKERIANPERSVLWGRDSDKAGYLSPDEARLVESAYLQQPNLALDDGVDWTRANLIWHRIPIDGVGRVTLTRERRYDVRDIIQLTGHSSGMNGRYLVTAWSETEGMYRDYTVVRLPSP